MNKTSQRTMKERHATHRVYDPSYDERLTRFRDFGQDDLVAYWNYMFVDTHRQLDDILQPRPVWCGAYGEFNHGSNHKRTSNVRTDWRDCARC